MNKILLILSREYLTRVKKKSFLIMTLLGPLLFGGVFGLSIWAGINAPETKTVEVLDESNMFKDKLVDDATLNFTFVDGPLEIAQERFRASGHDALLYVPQLDLERPQGIKLFSTKGLGLEIQQRLESRLEQNIEDERLLLSGIDRSVIENMRANISLDTKKLADDGEEDSNVGIATALGFIGAFLIYMFIFIYGVQIMRGVIEEKTNRIVEVIISSVKPFQLMAGKIFGIALVGLTQFLLWIMLTGVVYTAVINLFVDKEQLSQATSQAAIAAQGQAEAAAAPTVAEPAVIKAFHLLETQNIPLLLSAFLFYFLGGYLLYGSLFAGVGAAVDSETDTQQFMLPVTIPLILSFVMAQFAVRDPFSPLATWLSLIPFTSPVMMMVRLPFGVPIWELVLSMVLLVLGFLGTTWLAGRIYRVGILMYGKKVNYRELSKWVFYRQ
ncbi:ABC-2 type transport system permease protein [Catalinimonas alkaloidigena]|uniref:ABC-2 type transport system permease protein n=1 Tax=Catalinimonas alkaloidigena TaxID=1075417 RepID=A0A1G9MYH0_9BACT|nr:ABC transporter permease [Catalinimonas alkaloidigena]SDL79322.1 ABC-2 type transport system permease protein [Catalinimonas alkaloidigena]